jgi:hypothetical protein
MKETIIINKIEFILGNICKRGHTYNNTDKNLRYKMGACVRCVQMSEEEKKKFDDEREIFNKKIQQDIKNLIKEA